MTADLRSALPRVRTAGIAFDFCLLVSHLLLDEDALEYFICADASALFDVPLQSFSFVRAEFLKFVEIIYFVLLEASLAGRFF